MLLVNVRRWSIDEVKSQSRADSSQRYSNSFSKSAIFRACPIVAVDEELTRLTSLARGRSFRLSREEGQQWLDQERGWEGGQCVCARDLNYICCLQILSRPRWTNLNYPQPICTNYRQRATTLSSFGPPWMCLCVSRRTTRLQSSVPIDRREVSWINSRRQQTEGYNYNNPRSSRSFSHSSSVLSRVVNLLVPEVRMELNIFAIWIFEHRNCNQRRRLIERESGRVNCWV